jgi:hypothetical protein
VVVGESVVGTSVGVADGAAVGSSLGASLGASLIVACTAQQHGSAHMRARKHVMTCRTCHMQHTS